jgi:hypothetical protein
MFLSCLIKHPAVKQPKRVSSVRHFLGPNRVGLPIYGIDA